MGADVFVSYARSDSKFVQALVSALSERGKTPWLDVEGIEDGEVFPQALRNAIESTDGFVFVISPQAAASAFCSQEVEHALASGKRIVPLLHRPVPDGDLPQGISERQWINAGAAIDDDTADRLVHALDADLEHARTHTRLLIRAGEWESSGRDSSALARGNDLRDTEAWLTGAQGRDPAPTERHAAWIAAGRAAAVRRQHQLTAGAAGFGVVAVALLVFALFSRSDAIDARAVAQTERAVAQSRALGTKADQQIDFDQQRSLLLSNAALRSAGTVEAQFAAQQALDESTLRAQLPSVGIGGCPANKLVLLDGGRRAATSTCGGDVVLLDLARRRIVRRIKVGPSSNGLAVSPDESTLAVIVGEKTIVFVDVASGRVGERLRSRVKLSHLAYDARGRRIATAGSDGVGVYDLRTRRLRLVDRRSGFWRSVAWVRSRLVAGASGDLGGVPEGLYEFDLRRPGRPRRLIGPAAPDQYIAALSIAVTADGATVYAAGASGRDGRPYRATVWRLNARNGKVAWKAIGKVGVWGDTVAVSADGRSLAVGTQVGSEVRDAATGFVRVTHASTIPVRGIAFFGGAATSVVTSASDGIVRRWAAAGSERVVREIPGAVLVFFRGSTLMTAGTRLHEHDPGSGAIRSTVTFSPGDAPPDVAVGGLTAVTYRVFSDSSVTYTVRDTRTGRTLRRSTQQPGFAQTVVSPSGRLLQLMSYPPNDYTPAVARIVDLDRGTIHRTQPYALNCSAAQSAFSHDDRRLAVADDCGAVTIIDVASGRKLHQLRVAERTQAAEWAPDGRTFAITTHGGNVIVVTAATGRARILSEHTAFVNQAHYSPDGRWLVSASEDGTVNQWDTRTWRLARRHRIGTKVVSVAASPDGRLLATLDEKSTLRVWDLCDICQNTRALERATAKRAVRPLTALERATFSVE